MTARQEAIEKAAEMLGRQILLTSKDTPYISDTRQARKALRQLLRALELPRAADALEAKDRELAEARKHVRQLQDFNSRRELDILEIASQRDEAMAALREKEERVKALEADKARLDFLDACNAALNGRYGTNYGWSLVLTHNVTRLMLGRSMEVDLHDSEGGKAKLPSCRGAIDREMTRIDVSHRVRSVLSSVQPVSVSREQRGNEEG